MLFHWDQTRWFNLCMAVLTVPVTLGAIYSAYLVFSGPNLSTTALLLRAAIVYLSTSIRHGFADRFHNSGKAKSLGCGPVSVYPHKDPILGLDLVWQQLRRRNNHTVLEGFIDRFQRYGHTHYELVLGQRILMTDDAENVKTILATKFEDWPLAGPRLHAVLPLLGPNSIFSSNGEAWHKARAMLRPSFVRDQVADFRCFERHTGNLIRRIPTDGSPIDLQKLLLAMSMDSSTDFLLGYSTGLLTEDPLPDTEEFTRAFTEAALKSSLKSIVGPILFKLPDGSLDRDVRKVRDFVRYYLRKVAAEKTENKLQDSERVYVFLDELLKQEAPEQYIVDQILSVLIAGRDTTAMGIAACFWFLARLPDVVAKLRDEISTMNAHDPTWEQLKNMKFLNSVIKECKFWCFSTVEKVANELRQPCV
jgi:cytochrome P450